MSLDYWRNKEKTCYLSYNDAEYFMSIMEDLNSGDSQLAFLDLHDLENLRNSINVILDQ